MSLSIRNKKRIAAIALACTLAIPAFANAYDLDAHLGYYFDSEAIALGFGLLNGLGDSDHPRWFFNPNAQAIMGDNRDMFALNGDFHYDFAATDDLTFWAGAGPGVYLIDQPGDDNDAEFGLNLLAGFGAQQGSVRPFLQGKAIIMDDSEASIAVGIRF